MRLCVFVCVNVYVYMRWHFSSDAVCKRFRLFLLVVVVLVSRPAYKALLFELPRDYVRV